MIRIRQHGYWALVHRLQTDKDLGMYIILLFDPRIGRYRAVRFFDISYEDEVNAAWEDVIEGVDPKTIHEKDYSVVPA